MEAALPANINTAIAAVYAAVGYVQKQQGGRLPYTYASEAALIEALRPAMVEAGGYVSVSEFDDVQRETYITREGTTREGTTREGTTMNRVCLRARVRFTHAPSGTYI